MWYIYIIKSQVTTDYYKGISEDVYRRLEEHNTGLSNFTKSGIPWVLVYFRQMESKRDAIIEERRIKRLNRRALEKMIGNSAG